jgi:spermidine/putrescine-binding protein
MRILILFFSILLLCEACGGKETEQAVASPTETVDRVTLCLRDEYFSQDTLGKFAAISGYKVDFRHNISDENLNQMMSSGSCDVIMASNKTIHNLKAKGMLQKLEKSKLPKFSMVNRKFLAKTIDPGNDFWFPVSYGVAGIYFDSTKIKESIDSYSALWNPKYTGHILMTEEAVLNIDAALRFKNRPTFKIGAPSMQESKNLLVQQKPLVHVYSADLVADMKNDAEIWIAYGTNRKLLEAKRNNAHLDFIVPKEGASLWIDNLAIPASATHKEGAYKFLEFYLEPSIAGEVSNNTGYANTNEEVSFYLHPEVSGETDIYLDAPTLSRCDMDWDDAAFEAAARIWKEVRTP